MSTRATAALDSYTKACEDRDRHIADNTAVFKAHEMIVNRIIDAENNLRDIVAEENAPVSNGEFRVTITPQTQTVFDEAKILGDLHLTREQALSQRIITDNPRPPRITIGRQPRPSAIVDGI